MTITITKHGWLTHEQIARLGRMASGVADADGIVYLYFSLKGGGPSAYFKAYDLIDRWAQE